MNERPIPICRSANQSGIALVIVLWAIALLAVIAASFTATTRGEVNLARNLVENAKAEALADAGVYRAVLALLRKEPTPVFAPEIEELLEGRPALREALMDRPEVKAAVMGRLEAEGTLAAGPETVEPGGIGRPGEPWRADGTVYPWPFGGEVWVSIQDEGGKIDLNAAPDELLKGLFVSVGLDEAEAAALVDAIVDFGDEDDFKRLNGAEDDDYRRAGLPWGAKDGPFEAVEELQRVMGMTRELYERVAPLVTVYTDEAGIDPTTAPREVLLAVPGVLAEDVESVLANRGEAETGGFVGLIALEDYLSRSTSRVYTVRAEARTEGGAVFVREAVVEFTGDPDRPFEFYAWRQGARAPAQSREAD